MNLPSVLLCLLLILHVSTVDMLHTKTVSIDLLQRMPQSFLNIVSNVLASTWVINTKKTNYNKNIDYKITICAISSHTVNKGRLNRCVSPFILYIQCIWCTEALLAGLGAFWDGESGWSCSSAPDGALEDLSDRPHDVA